MRQLILGIVVLFSGFASAVCTKHCTPGVSYACGNGCTSIYNKCHKATTTACNDGTGSKSRTYSTPKKVEPKEVSRKDGVVYGRGQSEEKPEEKSEEKTDEVAQ